MMRFNGERLHACSDWECSWLRCVLLHALNPYGFAWLRRVNEHNVDLNRNFLLPGEAYRGSPAGYAALDPLLNPKSPPARWAVW